MRSVQYCAACVAAAVSFAAAPAVAVAQTQPQTRTAQSAQPNPAAEHLSAAPRVVQGRSDHGFDSLLVGRRLPPLR